MKKEQFEKEMKAAAKKFADKKTPSRPETQFAKGATWAWELMMAVHSENYYEERLRSQIAERLGEEPDGWMDEIIQTTAQLLVDRDETRAEIRETGRTWKSFDKNYNEKKESCPHIAHEKDIMRSLALYYESLGLSFKSNPKRITENTKKGGTEHDKMRELFDDLNTLQ